MILNVSGRTDIIAFYTDWFMNRYKEGYVDVRNPFNPKLVSRINFKNVDLLFFCTKNPLPILKRIKEISHPIIFHITITPYLKEIEPNVPIKKDIIEGVKYLSKTLGKDKIVVRYDPIFLSEKYSISYHKKAFERLCEQLDGFVNKIIISFIDEYKNVKKNKNILKIRKITQEDYKEIGISFSTIAKKHHIIIHTCFEDENLVEYGFVKGECISHELALELTGKEFNNWTARKERKCNCVEMVDIGVYNTCKHFCKYCYANYDEKQVLTNTKYHDQKSSLLIGKLTKEDIIKERKDNSKKFRKKEENDQLQLF